MKAFLFVFVFFCCGCVAILLSVTDLHVCLELGCKLGFFFLCLSALDLRTGGMSFNGSLSALRLIHTTVFRRQ